MTSQSLTDLTLWQTLRSRYQFVHVQCPVRPPNRLEDHVDVGVAEGAPARLGGDRVAAVVDVRAPQQAPALDEVVRVQPAGVLDPRLQHPGMNQLVVWYCEDTTED